MWEVLPLPRCSRMRVEMFPRRNRHCILHKWIYARHANGDGKARDPSHLQIKNKNSRTWSRKLAINTSRSFAPIFWISLWFARRVLVFLMPNKLLWPATNRHKCSAFLRLRRNIENWRKGAKMIANEAQFWLADWLYLKYVNYVSNRDFCLIGW